MSRKNERKMKRALAENFTFQSVIEPFIEHLPAILERSSSDAEKHFWEYFALAVRNKNTRAAYIRAVYDFFAWLEENTNNLALLEINRTHVEGFIASKKEKSSSVDSIKLSLAALRGLFAWLKNKKVIPLNPARDVKGPKRSYRKIKTQPVALEDIQSLYKSIPMKRLIDFRDRALISVMAYAIGRVSAALSLNLENLHIRKHALYLQFNERDQKIYEVPANKILKKHIDEYRKAAGLFGNDNTPLFQTIRGRKDELTGNRMSRKDSFAMVRRRAKAAGIDATSICNHSFRTTGITTLLKNGGKLADTAHLAAHANISTTSLYDDRKPELTKELVDKIRY